MSPVVGADNAVFAVDIAVPAAPTEVLGVKLAVYRPTLLTLYSS